MKKWIFFLIVFSLIGLVTAFGFDSLGDVGFGFSSVAPEDIVVFKSITTQNLEGFPADFFMPLNTSVFGDFSFGGNITSGIDFCITNGNCLSTVTGGPGGVASPWSNNSLQVFVLESFPTFINVSDTLFVNKSLGFVGIGTSTPTQKLNVVGVVNFTSDFWIDETSLFVNATTNRIGIGTRIPDATLNVIGDLNQTQGNFTGNNLFGSMSNIDFAGVTISLTVVNQFENVTGLNATEENGFTFFNNTLVPQIPGRYLVRYSFSGTSAANSIYLIGISVNNIIDNGTLSQTTIGAGGNVQSIGGGGIIDLNVGDLVNLQVADNNAPAQDIVYTTASVGILRISE